MASTGRSAFSQDGQYYAYCGNDGKLKIWETASGRLKHEYTPNRHLSSPCSVIGWISVSPQSPGNISVNAPCALQPLVSSFPFFRFIYVFIVQLYDFMSKSRQFSVFVRTNICPVYIYYPLSSNFIDT